MFKQVVVERCHALKNKINDDNDNDDDSDDDDDNDNDDDSDDDDEIWLKNLACKYLINSFCFKL